jgi:RIO kinase 1
MAAPRLATAGLTRPDLERASAQLVENLVRMVEVGVVHADLSVYNLLWWDEQLWVIDVPQAVDISTNDHALDFLHRDLSNVGTWLRSRNIDFDIEGLFAELVGVALGG